MNAPLLSTPHVEPFFFDADPGTRFCLYHAPAAHVSARGAFLYLHPFAGDMIRARRLAAQQSRAFAAAGYAVLQVDLFGCGDSCGHFNAARWEIWLHDLALACDWLAARAPGPLHLWGMRLGGLLALDFATRRSVDTILLWEPFLHGRACMNDFLGQHPGACSTASLRVQLATHGMIEVGGFEAAMPLVRAIDACDAARMQPRARAVHWCAPASPRTQATATRVGALWQAGGATLRLHHADTAGLAAASLAIYAGDQP